jgi:uncharacterized pyridoxamine 5'-phosphate oxidase family protein
MKKFFAIFATIVLHSSVSFSQNLNDHFTLCIEGESVIISNRNLLEITRFKSTQIHRFEGDKVYLSTSTEKDYFFNTIKKIEFGRYSSGNKTYIFNNYESGRGSVVSIDNINTKINVLECRKK